MSWLASCILYVFHAVYYVINLASSLRAMLDPPPNPLAGKRKQVPTHLALLVTTDQDALSESLEQELLDNIQQAVSWCRTAGVQRLTVYDREGSLYTSSFELRTRIYGNEEADTPRELEVDSEVQYPLTPPASDSSSSSSRSLSPEYSVQPKLHVTTISIGNKPKVRQSKGNGALKRRAPDDEKVPAQPFTLHIISRKTGKPAVADLATCIAHDSPRSAKDRPTVSIERIKSVLEGEHGFPPPELMIVHHITPHRSPKSVLELHGFPPWQVSLTEFYYTTYPQSWWKRWRLQHSEAQLPFVPLTELDFCRALDQFAGAEMRLGK